MGTMGQTKEAVHGACMQGGRYGTTCPQSCIGSSNGTWVQRSEGDMVIISEFELGAQLCSAQNVRADEVPMRLQGCIGVRGVVLYCTQ